MIDKLKELVDWAQQLENAARRLTDIMARGEELGFMSHTLTELRRAPDPVPEEPRSERIPQPAGVPYTGPTDQEMWEDRNEAGVHMTPVDGKLTISQIRAVIADEVERSKVGLHPAVIEAIQRWETGNYESPKARAWLDANNPGGMKYHVEVSELPAFVGPSGIKWSAFKTQESGIRAHVRFFLRDPYRFARNTTSPLEQVKAIWEAGYSEKDPEWLLNATRLAKQYLVAYDTPRVNVPDRGGDTIPVSAKIRGSALLLLTNLFPYSPGTEDGNLGCADVVSEALVRAGILPKRLLSVAEVMAALKSRGWLEVQSPYKDGDVVEWGPSSDSNGHHHIGILIIMNNEVQTIQNSSSQRKVVQRSLAGYHRPLVKVLRHPEVK